MAYPAERKPSKPSNPVLSPQQAQAIIKTRDTRPHLPAALEVHVDPPGLEKEFALLRGLIREAGKTETQHKISVDTKMAHALWALNQHKKNRKVMSARVALLSTVYLEKRFRAVVPMYIDWDGNFRDGQHRVRAVLATGMTIEFKVVFGMDPDDFRFLDAGMRRTAAQFLDLDDVKSASEIAAIVRLKHRTEHQGAVLDDHAVFLLGKDIADELMSRALAAGARLRKSQKVILSSAALAYRIIATESKRAASIDEFWDRLVLGDQLETTDPIYKLRGKFGRTASDKARKGHQYLTQAQHAAWIINAWNAWARHDTAVSFNWPDPNSLPAVK